MRIDRLAAIALTGSLTAAAPIHSQGPLKLDAMGGPGGNHVEYACGPGRVLVGVRGYAGVWIDSVQAICGRYDPRGNRPQGAEGPVFGGSQRTNKASVCQGDVYVVAGLEADENKDNRFLGYIAVACKRSPAANLQAAAPAFAATGRLASQPDRPSGSELFVRPARQECPAGTVAVGIHGRAGRFLDALGLICGPLPGVPETRGLEGQYVSFQSFNYPDRHIRHRGWLAYTDPIRDELGKKDARFKVVAGLAEVAGMHHRCASFESENYPDHFLRHEGYRLKLAKRRDGQFFGEDATFCAVQGLGSGIILESVNAPGHYIRHRQSEVWLDRFDGTDLFRRDATFHLRSPLH